MNDAETLLAKCRAANLKVSTAESCTGGLLSGAITEVAGSSDIFDRGFVTYTNEAKVEMLGVRTETLEAFGAVSEQVAFEMAEGALQNSAADIAVSVTGIAGPGGSDFKPEGRVCFGLAKSSAETFAETVEFGALGRKNVRLAAVAHALNIFLKAAS
ncbi:CinA family protein [Pseudohalocynthiibacter aestuariivivens]|jgi:nicotinamide-nucleotide amidase|uniref:CinA family protein n=1 Tax=Pseudohalocynthiibacter aestuariivivens TaxID=1591409 RepID=A0ABV5JFZ7_9RHOB|nr:MULTISPECIES: CinA family protein [Pseudohalocynthiibacter]MBS9716286.1 CinA family protein [Pseudohalocynthiibacter aestuariivivens]MCK0100906.1 CinA family protein [Pseudohalocynthiibacter sp. F2068]